MPGSILGNAVPRVEDPGILIGASRYVDDLPIERRAPLPVRAVADRARPHHRRSMPTTRARCPGVVGRVHRRRPRPRAARRLHPRARAVRAAAARPRQGLLRRRPRRGGGRRDPRRRPSTRRRRWSSTTTRSRPPSTWRARSRRTRPLQLEALGTNLAIGRREGDGADVLADADARRACAHREPAGRGGADGGRRGRRRTGRRRSVPAHRLPRDADAAPLLERDRRGDGTRPGRGARGRAERGRRVRGQGVGHVRALCRCRVRAAARSAGEVGRDTLGEPRRDGPRAGPGAVHRDGVHRATVSSRGCDAAWWATPARTAASAGVLVGGDHAPDGHRRVPRPEAGLRGRGRGHEHHADGRVPRRGPTRGRGVPRTGDGPRRRYELGIDPVELRRRNFLAPDDFPFTTLTGARYDSGDYDAALREAVRVAGYDDLRAEQAARRARGDRMQLGLGVAVYVEVTGGGSGNEWGALEIARRRSARRSASARRRTDRATQPRSP